MRIALDARMMGPLVTRGIGRYIEELVRGLIGLRTGHTLVLLVRDPERSPFVGIEGIEHIRADVPWYGFREQREMPRLLRSARADVVHVPHWNVPLLFRRPFVVTIHDILLLQMPWSAKRSTKNPVIGYASHLGLRATLWNVARRAGRVFVPTHAVAADIRSALGVEAERIIVTGEGITVFPAADRRLVPDEPFLLAVGSAYPHKRLDLLLRVWSLLAPRYPNHALYIVGEKDLFMDRLIKETKRMNIPRIQFLGRVSDAELRGLYERATALVFPSSAEGFGLPPLEALSLGCPVVVSDILCLQETMPTNGVQRFRSGDADDMIRAIESVLSDPSSIKRSASQARTEIQARFDWNVTAKKTMEGYLSML